MRLMGPGSGIRLQTDDLDSVAYDQPQYLTAMRGRTGKPIRSANQNMTHFPILNKLLCNKEVHLPPLVNTEILQKVACNDRSLVVIAMTLLVEYHSLAPTTTHHINVNSDQVTAAGELRAQTSREMRHESF